MPASAKASNRLPSSEIANRSRITCQAFSPGMMQRASTSMHPDSLIPLSTTRASSIDSGLGGPASQCRPATGLISAEHIKPPWLGRSGYGFITWNLTPAKTMVSPILTLAEPSALGRTEISASMLRPSQRCLPSMRASFSANSARWARSSFGTRGIAIRPHPPLESQPSDGESIGRHPCCTAKLG